MEDKNSPCWGGRYAGIRTFEGANNLVWPVHSLNNSATTLKNIMSP